MMTKEIRTNTELDKQLQELASADWSKFVVLIGPKNIMAAKICILRAKGKSYNQIALRMQTTFKIVRTKSSKCYCEIPAQNSTSPHPSKI